MKKVYPTEEGFVSDGSLRVKLAQAETEIVTLKEKLDRTNRAYLALKSRLKKDRAS